MSSLSVVKVNGAWSMCAVVTARFLYKRQEGAAESVAAEIQFRDGGTGD